MIEAPVVAYLLAVWIVVVLIPGLRNLRFIALLVLATTVMVGAQVLPSDLRWGVRIAVVVAVGLGILTAEAIGLGSLSRDERRVDRELQRAEKLAAGSGPSSVKLAIDIVDAVLASVAAVDVHWRAGLRLKRRAWLTRIGATSLPPSSATPAQSFDAAATRYLNDLRLRRTVGFRPSSGTFEEAIALRAYLDDVRSVFPRESIGPEPTPRGDWNRAAEAIIKELRSLRLHDADAMAVRDSLADMLAMELLMRTTAPTASDQVAYDQLSAELDERWRRLDAPLSQGAED